MNQDIKSQWITALRSGNYTQGQGYLATETSEGRQHCCLGVLCELAVEAGVIKPGQVTEPLVNFAGDIAYLPEVVAEWAGMDRYGIVREDSGELIVDVASMNDDNKSFEVIADAIKAHF